MSRGGILAAILIVSACDVDLNRQLLRCQPAAGWGQACSASARGECAEGLACDRRFCVLPEPGSSCRRDEECGPDLICRARRCRDPSLLIQQDDVCTDSRDCQSGLSCAFIEPGEPRRCRPLAESSMGCFDSLDCGAGAYCCLDPVDCRGADEEGCKPRRGLGQACRFSEGCEEGLVCTRDEVCGAPPMDNEPCLDRCAVNLTCEFR